ncbi:MAG: alpha/beta hydrolase [Gammaproteobacteria bacterium]|nr:alpha/beta hydrolase [Gammaproteobacteria bacterium]
MNDLSTDPSLSPRESTSGGTTYTVTGESTSALVFIHGVGMNADVWQPQIEHFGQNYQVFAYDFFGHGNSPLPAQEPTLDDYVEQLNGLCKELKLTSFSLIGHSMGALISVAFALKYPKKVRALVPMNIVYNRRKKDRDNVLARAEKVIETGEIGMSQPTLRRWFAGKDSAVEQNKITKIQKWLSEVSPYGYGHAYRLFALSDTMFVNKLSRLGMPVLYLTGSDDPNSTPVMSKTMAELTPKGDFFSITQEAHMMAYIAPEKVNKIIESFLNKHSQNND